MKKILFTIILLAGFFGNAQVPKKFIPKITSDMVDPSYKETIEGGGGSITIIDNLTDTSTDKAGSANNDKKLKDLIDGITSGTGNANVRAVTTQSELVEALGSVKILSIQSDFTLNSNITIPANAIITYGGGIVNVSTYTVTFVGNDLTDSKWNFFNGSVHASSTFKGTNKFYATNFGMLDNNNPETNNKNVIRQCLNIANTINGSVLVVDVKHTGELWTTPGVLQEKLSPFFPNHDTTSWLIGVGTSTTVIVEANINIIPNNTKESAVFTFYNGHGSEIILKGKIKGDRHQHNYDQVITVLNAATTSGDIQFSIREQDPFIDGKYLKIININIPVTASSKSTNKTEIVNFLNGESTLSDYTFTNLAGDDIGIVGQPGVYYRTIWSNLIPDTNIDATTGAVLDKDHSSYEWGYGVVWGSNATNCSIRGGGVIEDMHGDGINQDYQGNGTTPIVASDMSIGSINPTTGVLDTGKTEFRTLTSLRNTPTENLWFNFSAPSYDPLKTKWKRYWVSWYDASGIFIEKSPQLTVYEKYLRKPEFVKYRIEVDYPGETDFASFYYFLKSSSFSDLGVVEDIIIRNCRRQSVSNPATGLYFNRVNFEGVGGALPEWNIDYEDLKYEQIGGGVSNSIFTGGKGGIIVKGGQKLRFTGNRMNGISYNTSGGSTYIGGFDFGYGLENEASGNWTDFRNNTIARGVLWHHNNMYKGFMTFDLSGGVSSNNRYRDVLVRDTQVTGGGSANPAGKSTSISNNDVFIINEPWVNDVLINEYNSIKWVNRTIKFNDAEGLQNLDPTNMPLVAFNDTVNNKVKADNTIPDASFKGDYTNDLITGAVVADAYKHNVLFPYYAADNKGAKLNIGVEIQAGFPKSFTISDMKAGGALSLKLNQYATDGVGPFETIIIRDSDFTVPERSDATHGYLKNTAYGGNEVSRVVKSWFNKNVNIEFINCKFISKDVTTGYFAYFGHRGTTLLKDCTFDAPNAETINLTSRAGDYYDPNVYRGTNNGAITIIGARTPGNRITFTLDTGDVKKDY